MKEGLRKGFLLFLGSKAGVKQGEMMPRWILVISYILYPIYSLVTYNTLFNIDVYRQVIVWHKQKISFGLMDAFTKESPAGYWFRVERGSDGIMVIRQKCETNSDCEINRV